MKHIVCAKCGQPMDLGRTVCHSIGITQQACGPCGRQLRKDQDARIADFTRRAEARGLKVRVEMNNLGEAQLVGYQEEEQKKAMKYPFSQTSREKLESCEFELITLFEQVADVIDCTIVCGARSEADQNEAFRTGASKKQWPDSKHNPAPGAYLSEAVDVAPYPIDWNDRERFVYFAGIVKGIAHQLDIKIRWGGDWDGDNDLADQTFMDLVHFELIP